jgi:CheY-like chemotaxis protein
LSIPPHEIPKVRQQLRASLHLLVGYCDGLLNEPATPSDPDQLLALERALSASRQMRDMVNTALSDLDDLGDGVTVDMLYESLELKKHEVVKAMTKVIERAATSPLADYYADDVGAVREVAKYLLYSDPVDTPPHSGHGVSAAGPVPAGSKPTSTASGDTNQETPHERTARILIAEDSPDTRKALEAHLRHLGHEVETFANGQLALERAREEPTAFDLVLSDLAMPEMDGFELLERLKADSATRDLPVIIISGFDDMPSVVRCIERGAEDHLPKPFERVLLNARVTATLEKKRMRDKEVDYLGRVEEVISAARAVEEGQYVPGRLANIVHRTDELGRLAWIFDSMVSGVKERQRRLENHVRELRREIRNTIEVHQVDDPVSESASLDLNTVFADRYEIVEELGRGGMGMVYRALDRELEEEVAVKTVRNDLLSIDTSMIQRLKTELRLARSISHRNVVRSYDFGHSDGTYYLTMEYVKGITLRELINSRGLLGVSSTLAIGAQLADALSIAHEQGVIHGDIKPRNLLLDDAGLLKVMDFGIARPSQAASRITFSETAVGSPRYMAPEQLFGQAVDTRADLYSAGVVLYECLVGEVPVDAPTPLALAAKILEEERIPPGNRNSAVPPALSALILRLLAIHAPDRLASATELAALLRQIH